MKKWCFALIILLSAILPNRTTAQEFPTIKSLEIDLWPEYDQHELLVIYRIELSTQVSPPVELSFRIPVEVGEPHAVAVRDTDGSLLTAPYERTVDGNWAVITLVATMPGIQLEYYDPKIQKEDSHRTFQYTWPGDYPVEALSVQIQQPFDANQIKITPNQTAIVSGSDGLSYHTVELGSQPAGVSTKVSVEYNKTNDALTVERLPVKLASPISSNKSSLMNLNFVPWGLGILGVSLLTGGIYWYWQLGKQQPQPKIKPYDRKSISFQKQFPLTDDVAVYCHQCGKRAAKGDRFCRSCGTRLRRNGVS